jgi:hypothetical protein
MKPGLTRFAIGAMAVALFLGVLLPATSASALPGICVGPVALKAGAAITGTVNSTVILPSGSSTITDATITGSVIVPAGASVTILNSTIGGSIVARQGASVLVCASTVGGALDAVQSPAGITVCASTMKGAINVTGSTGPVLIGDLFGSFCGANHLAAGANNLFNNTGKVTVIGNKIDGTLNVNRNSGGVTVGENTIGGSLNCLGNMPPPGYGANPNVVHGMHTGQCVGLDNPPPP